MNELRENNSPIACALTDAQLVRRKEQVAGDIWSGATHKTELQDGYEFAFPGTDEWVDRLLQFVKAERQCCRFFLFELIFAPNTGPITLRLSGPDGTKQFMESML
jgi:hypothetical protein